MDILINTANNLEVRQSATDQLEKTVREHLSRFEDHLTRVELYVGDETNIRSDHDIRCQIEARPAGHQPVSVTDQGDTIDQATSGALAKLTTVLDRTIGKTTDRKGH